MAGALDRFLPAPDVRERHAVLVRAPAEFVFTVARSFEVTPDGQRFVAFGREDPLLFTLVLDWAARLPGLRFNASPPAAFKKK